MKFFLIALVFLLSLGQLQRIQITNQLAFYLHDLLIIGYLIVEFFKVIKQRKKIQENLKKITNFQKKIIFGLFSLIFVGWFFAVVNNHFDPRAILYVLRLLAYIAFIASVQINLKNKSWLWRLISFNILILGFVQYLFLPDLRFLIYAGYDDHFYRLTSTILDPAFTGLIFVFNLNYYLWQKKKNLALVSLFTLGLLLTYSRSSYLAFFISNLLMFFFTKEKAQQKIISWLTVIFIICLPLLPKQSGGTGVDLGRTITAQARINNDQEILRTMQTKDWLIGQGLFIPSQNRQTSINIPSHAHFADNLLVFLVSNLGIIGSSLLIIVVWQNIKQNKWQMILTTSLITHAMFNNNLTQSFVLLIFLGLIMAKDQATS